MKIRKSYISALVIAGLIVGWMYSDDLLGTSSLDKADKEKVVISELEKDVISSPDLITQAFKVLNQKVPLQVRARGVTRTGFEIDV
ncbi:MAG: hypothetical protein RMX55_08585, partial [Planktomarina sp.]|nr:hypothetical protein [Planktomarina sp.]